MQAFPRLVAQRAADFVSLPELCRCRRRQRQIAGLREQLNALLLAVAPFGSAVLNGRQLMAQLIGLPNLVQARAHLPGLF
ncbi:hypothetical protein C6T65_08790 [Burkholderia vietnamiensis]|uniref:Uncharacterized protein n=1 Tax=Burkholderia vietnamiensis TaxID=60552 RepID=A0AA44Y315_BURVI|nr:hypothetical protein C6T65_08790 [Burkholderia vietnamiensis]